MKNRKQRHAVVQPLDQAYRLIPLTQGQNAIVDAKDFEWLSQWNWCAVYYPSVKSFYAQRGKCIGGRKNRKTVKFKMHRVILDCGPQEDGDHKNGNTLDNRRDNLRPCTALQNAKNRGKNTFGASKFKGVSMKAWCARLTVDGRRIHIGYFSTEEEAARAYDAAAIIHHGAFARLNFPDGH